MARVLFYDTIQNQENYFDTFKNTIYNLFVLQTTSNYPDIMLPIYIEHRYAGIFFISYLTINYFLMFNMMIALVYFHFKEIVTSNAKLALRKKFISQAISRYLIEKKKTSEIGKFNVPIHHEA